MATKELDEFFQSFQQDVVARATASGELTRTAFVEECADRMVEAEAFQEWSPAYYDGRGQRRRSLAVDGYAAEELDLDGTLHLLIADLRESGSVEGLTTTDVRDASEKACNYIEEARTGRLLEVVEPSTPAADLARLVHERGGGLRTIKVHLISNAAIGSRFREVRRTSIEKVKVEVHVWDLGRFRDLAEQGGREELDIDLTEFAEGGIPALPASIGDARYTSYLAVMPGALLADVYDRFGSRLLEGNVRAFLSTKVKVNKGIRNTILNQPTMFFAFNNGITATATEVKATEGRGGCRLTRVRDLQIVNGGQTTASLFNARVKDGTALEGVFVQVKLSVLSPEDALVLIPDISRYANTQNKVSDADLFANHPFHRAVEDISRRIWAPARSGAQQMTHWFYERARAQYQSETSKLKGAEKKRFELQNPPSQKIEKTDLALYENTWRMLPHVVSLGAQKNFVAYANEVCAAYDQQPSDFNERWFQHVVAKALVFQEIERLVSQAGWYKGGYRRNIVTYGIARFLLLLKQQFRSQVVDLDRVWRTQSVSEDLGRQLLACAEAAARMIANPPPPWTNVTEWAKKEACWNAVSSEPVPKVADIEADLKEVGAEREARHDAREQAVEDGAINAIVQVVQLANSGTLSRALAWPRTKKLLTETEQGILRTAVARKGWAPSDAQARRLMTAMARLKEEGFQE